MSESVQPGESECICGHANYAHDYRFGTCYETGEGRCRCLQYQPADREDRP